MLFKVTQRPVRDDNPELLAVPEFMPLSDRELKWVFLVYDFKTVYRQLSLADRKESAAENKYVGYRRESAKRMDKSCRNLINTKLQEKNLPHIAPAIEAFKKMQRDLDIEILQAYEQNIEDHIKKIKEPKNNKADWELNAKITKTYLSLIVSRKVIKENLDLRGGFEEEVEEQAEEKVLSTLDKVMRAKIEENK